MNPDNLTVINEKIQYQFNYNIYRYYMIYSPAQNGYLILYNENDKTYIKKIDSLGNKTEVIIDEVIKEVEEEIEEILKEEKEEKIEEELIEQKEEKEILKEEKQEQIEESVEEE